MKYKCDLGDKEEQTASKQAQSPLGQGQRPEVQGRALLEDFYLQLKDE